MKNITKKEPTSVASATPEPANTAFKSRVVRDNVVARYQSPNDTQFDLDKALTESQEGMAALEAKGGLQEMLAAQMLSIHQFQQTTMAYANNINDPDGKKYYTNTAIKLANCFVQQASLFAKLQGSCAQSVSVKHVEVNQGGQAIVGNVGDFTHGGTKK